MTSKMIFLNICVAVVVFSLFLLIFLKPKTGPQFEMIKSEEKVKNIKVTPMPSTSIKITPTVKITPTSTP